MRLPWRWLPLLLSLWLCSGWTAAHTGSSDPLCAPQIRSVTAAMATSGAHQPPGHGWEAVSLPDNWGPRWPGHDGTVWYRVDWARDCQAPSNQAPVALSIDFISMAGEVYSNQDLLWRDPHLQEPLSRSWNQPRYWLLPASSLQASGTNTLWIRTEGIAALMPGLGRVKLGTPEHIFTAYQQQLWDVRTLFTLNLTISAVLGVLALFFWLPQRKQPVFGWYACVSVCWVWFGSNILQTETWPYPDNLVLTRFNHVAYISYVTTFILFCWHLLECPRPRRQTQALLWLTAGTSAAVLAAGTWEAMPWAGNLYTALFLANLVLVLWHAGHTRRRAHLLVAGWLLVVVLMMVRDFLVVLNFLDSRQFYSPYSSLLFMVMSALLIRRRVVRNALRIEQFNQELSETVERACSELGTTLAQEHALALHNAQLQERLQLAQDLHDGLGGQIVRSIMLVEQNAAPPSKERYLAMLKLLRDDLRQVVDSDGSIGAIAPATPEEWTIPLRHRFVSLFDELDMRSEWLAPQHWETPPSALQCMLLARVAEEALTNTVKHSHARMVRVKLQYTDTHLVLRIADDGVGFDAPTALRAGLGIGMSSMRARMERMGGALQVYSHPGTTVIEASLPLSGADAEVPARALPSMPRVPVP